MKEKIELTFERVETVRISAAGYRVIRYCPHCRVDVEMTRPRIAAYSAGVGEREIFRLIEAGRIHFFEADQILICLNQLARLGGVVLKIEAEE